MMNQSITTQSNMSTCVAESVFFANKVVNQAAVWAGEAAELRAQANKAREEVKTNKKARTIFRIAAPFMAGQATAVVLLVLSSIGLNLDGVFAKILMVPMMIAGIILVWKIPFKTSQMQAKAEELERLAADKDNEIAILVDQYRDELSVIPEEYCYPMATNYLADLFRTGRATNLPMALDKLEQQIHRWNMEAAAQETLACQMQQAETLQKVQRNTAVSATADTVSAIANIANFLTR